MGTTPPPVKIYSREPVSYYRARYYDPRAGRFLSEDPAGFTTDTNFYPYVWNDASGFTDPSGRIPLIVLLPVIGGTIGGITDVLNAGPCESKLKAFGRGFASGALGTLAGIGAGLATGNPWLAGAASGEVSSITDQALSRGWGGVDAGEVVVSTGVGGLGGGALSKLVPTQGRLPSLTRGRTPSNFGPNSGRLTLQEAGTDALGGAAQIHGHGGSGCGCSK